MRKDDHLIWESFKNKLSSAGPDAALRNTGAGENEEDDGEDVPYASGQVGGRGEEYGTGEVKLLLLREEKFDCYLNGTVQSVAFFRGTIFNCEPFDGEFYNCESDEYGTIAITPDAHLKILDAPEGTTNTEDEDAEEPHGYPGGMTAIQNTLINQLKKHGFALTKISHADKDRDKYPTVFMMRSRGPMHNVVEIDGMGTINGEPYQEYLHNLKHDAEDAESADERKERVQRGWDMNKKRWAKWKMENPEAAAKHAAKKAGKSEDAESYDAMTHLTQAANQIRDILQSNADDEAQVEHIIRMAQIILGDKKDYSESEYRKMLDGLIVLLNRFIIVPMN